MVGRCDSGQLGNKMPLPGGTKVSDKVLTCDRVLTCGRRAQAEPECLSKYAILSHPMHWEAQPGSFRATPAHLQLPIFLSVTPQACQSSAAHWVATGSRPPGHVCTCLELHRVTQFRPSTWQGRIAWSGPASDRWHPSTAQPEPSSNL